VESKRIPWGIFFFVIPTLLLLELYMAFGGIYPLFSPSSSLYLPLLIVGSLLVFGLVTYKQWARISLIVINSLMVLFQIYIIIIYSDSWQPLFLPIVILGASSTLYLIISKKVKERFRTRNIS